MTAISARLPGERGPGLLTAAVGLGLFAIVCGIGLAIGELDALLGAITVLACFATLADYRLGAVLLVIMLPVQGSNFFPHSVFGVIGLNPLNLVLAATLVSYLMRGYGLKRFLPKPLVWLFIAPMVVAGLIGMPHVVDIHPAFYEEQLIQYTSALGYLGQTLLKPLSTVLIAIMIGAAVARVKKAESFLIPVIASVWVMSLMAISYVVAEGVSLGALALTTSRTFFSGLGMHANDLGRLYAVAYALLLFTWGETKDLRLKSVLIVTMGLLTIALVLTFSRGAMVGWVLVNALFLVWKFNAKTIGLALLAGGAGLLVMPGAVVSRMSLGLVGGADVNEFSAGRMNDIWIPLFPELFKSPIWGNGLDSIMWSKAMWTDQMAVVTHPHNAYMQAILDMGLVGMALLLAFYWHVYRSARDLGSNAYLSPTMRGFYQGLVASLLCFIITGFVGSSLRPSQEFAFLWIAIGMMYGQLARRRMGT
ncbi:MAG TPA: O-antigen ligase family protein [Burkholderiales bacterium]|nr:O-antigen ligase family protein [Burkholderiales bacterium]